MDRTLYTRKLVDPSDVSCTYSSTKSLLWAEPWEGNGYFKNDTGLTNRLLHWEVGYYFNYKNNNNFEIKLQEYFWPELHFCDLPNTSLFKFSDEDGYKLNYLKFITSYNIAKGSISKAVPLTTNVLEEMKKKGNYKLINEYDYYSNFDFDVVNLYTSNIDELEIRPCSFLRLKNLNFENLIKKFVGHRIGLHIRRGSGVKRPDIFTNNLKGTYELLTPSDESDVIPFVEDYHLYNVVGKILAKNSAETFFISSDLEKIDLSKLVQKFPGKFLFKEDILKPALDILINDYSIEMLTFHMDTIKNLIDFFGYNFSKFHIGTPGSTWSLLPFHLKNLSPLYLNDSTKLILSSLDEIYNS